MDSATYQEMPCISSHWLMAMLDSPAECWRKYLDPKRATQPQTDSMRFGALAHCLALTPHRFEREFIVADYERRSIAGKARYAELAAEGLTVVKPAEVEKARALVAALRADPEARKLLRGGKKERTIIQPRADGLLPLKARLDLHAESKRLVVELKTTHGLNAVSTAIERYRYPVQAAFYADISKSVEFVFVFVETREPYRVSVREIDRERMREGRAAKETALWRFDACWLANDWPEAEPSAPAMDDDPLMMPGSAPEPMAPRRRNVIRVGELAL